MVQKRFDFQQYQLEELRKRITRVRKQVGTQKYVAKSIGISQGHISRIESGNHNAIPGTDYLQQLAQLAKVSYMEEMLWIGMAGHLPWTRMPSVDQISSILEIYCDDIARDTLPSYIIDYRLMVWAHNQASYKSTSYETGIQILQNGSTLFDVLFRSDYQFSSSSSLMSTLFDTVASRAFQRIPVRMFHMLNLMRRHEPFYQLYPQYVENRLGNIPEDSRAFREIWDEITTSDIHDEQYYASIMRNHVDSGVHLRPMNFRGINDATFEFGHTFEVITHMPQFSIVRLRARSKDPEAQMILSSFGEHDDALPLYQSLWQSEVDGIHIMEQTIESYNADNLYG